MGKNYYLAANQLENVPNILDLGITIITNNLSWSKHIEKIVSKANRTLGLVKRLCRDIKDTNLLTQVNIVYLSKMFSVELPGLFLINLKICHIH